MEDVAVEGGGKRRLMAFFINAPPPADGLLAVCDSEVQGGKRIKEKVHRTTPQKPKKILKRK